MPSLKPVTGEQPSRYWRVRSFPFANGDAVTIVEPCDAPEPEPERISLWDALKLILRKRIQQQGN